MKYWRINALVFEKEVDLYVRITKASLKIVDLLKLLKRVTINGKGNNFLWKFD